MFGGIFAGLGAGLLGGALNWFGARRAQQRNEANSWSMWHAQNAYNDPSAVMQRLKNAGLNPNLAYGHMPMGSAPLSVPSMAPVKSGDFDFSLAQSMENMELQNQSLREQIQNQQQMRANMLNDQYWKSTLSHDSHVMNGLTADQARLNLGLDRLDAALFASHGSRAAYDAQLKKDLIHAQNIDALVRQGLSAIGGAMLPGLGKIPGIGKLFHFAK